MLNMKSSAISFQFRALLLLFVLLFSNTSLAAVLTSERVIEEKGTADQYFYSKNYVEAIKRYYDLAKQPNATNDIRADSWKKAGIIKYLDGKNSTAKDHFGKAMEHGLSEDEEIIYLLGTISEIDSINRNDVVTYIIQVGFFKSTLNANNVIRNITPPAGDFTVSKKKVGDFYLVYFDGFKSSTEADKAVMELQPFNDGLKFYVKPKSF